MRRRAFSFAALVGVAAVCAASASGASPTAHRPKTPIRHLISVMQENHTYDNYFGTYPRGDGFPPGVCVPVDPKQPKGRCIRPFHIGDNDVVPSDLDHSSSTAEAQWDEGRLDGFVNALDLRNEDGRLAMGYRDGRDLPYYWNLADQYVLYDHFFSSARSGSVVNHVYWVAGRPGSESQTLPRGGYRHITTIFDRLEAAGVSWKFYVQNYKPKLTFRTLRHFPGNRASQVIWVPLLSMPRYLDSPELRSHIVPLDQYFADLQHGTLPAVSYIVPSGPSEHPPSSIASGQAFVRSLANALIASPEWKSSAFLLAYDDWGGWYDHVNPPQVDRYGYGFRVPALLVSPYARRAVVHTQLDFTSILRFIEDNWSVAPLSRRNASAESIASGFDFSQPPRRPAFTSPVRGVTFESHVRRSVIYVLYLGALAVTAALVVFALLDHGRGRPRRTRQMGSLPE